MNSPSFLHSPFKVNPTGRVMVSQTIGLETVGKAIQALAAGTSDAIKILIDPGRLRE